MSERTVNPAIVVENLVQRFRVIHERPDTVRELFSRFFRKEYNYHDFDAVHKVSFTVPKGQVLGIIGRNGSGKSTLLKIIAGVYRPTQGKVEVHGQVAPLIELGAGMHGELTGRENILLNGLMMGYSKKQMLDRERKIIEFAEIGDFIDVPVKQYSSGMYMRLAFSVATEIDPDILVIDEILAVGDAPFQDKCFKRLRNFRESGKTILLVSHSLDQIEQVCDRCLVMDRGRLAFDGNTADAIEAYKGGNVVAAAHELAGTRT